MKINDINVFRINLMWIRAVLIVMIALLALTMSSCDTSDESTMSSTDTINEENNANENEGIVIGGDVGSGNTIIINRNDEPLDSKPVTNLGKDKTVDKQIAAAIAEAEELAASGDYNAAITQIQTWLKTYSDSEILQEKLAEYTTARNTKIKVDAIAAADELRNQGNYLDALLTIRQAIAEIGEDDDLTTQAATCESAYATIVSQQVDEFQQKMSISEAKELLREALEHVPENELLISRMTEMESYKTVPLDTLSPINGGFTWNDGTPA
ncbi:MAG: hypothetical protein IJ265_05295, partial [Oscillospiraceae bacterium]|nr:hypothetical protein [Oscillospiraceae bacterium]